MIIWLFFMVLWMKFESGMRHSWRKVLVLSLYSTNLIRSLSIYGAQYIQLIGLTKVHSANWAHGAPNSSLGAKYFSEHKRAQESTFGSRGYIGLNRDARSSMKIVGAYWGLLPYWAQKVWFGSKGSMNCLYLKDSLVLKRAH